MLGDLWDSIPAWVIIAIVGAVVVGAFFVFRLLGWPMGTFWMLLGGIGGAVVIGLIKGAVTGGGGGV